ncbi:MAG: PAS domain-containing protein, partial [Terriglobales bacterium]
VGRGRTITPSSSPEVLAVEAPARIASARIIRASQKHPVFDLLEGSAAVGTFHLNLEKNTVEWSDEVFRRYGIDPSDNVTLGDAWQKIHPEDRAAVAKAVSEGIAAGTGYRIEFRVTTRDGKTVWNSTRARIRGSDVVGVVFDITEQKLADLALRDSEERFRGVFHNAIVPMVLAEPDGSFLRANAAFCRLVGYTEEELRGQGFQRLTHPDDLPHNMQLHQDLIAGRNDGFTIEKRYFRKDGEVVWVRANMSLVRDAKGAPLQVIAIAEDITTRKKVEVESVKLMGQLDAERAQLRSAIEQLRLIEETVNAGTWVFDIETGMSHWPPGISALWGLPRQHHQVSLEEFARRMYPEDRERVTAVIQKALASGSTYHVDFRVVWPDNSVHWLGARGAVVTDAEGKPKRVIGIALETTQQVKTEQALRQSEKLAAAGRLAATIAHEINNPLEAVTNLLYISLDNPELPAAVREYMQLADQELTRVSHIARQTLGFYRESADAEEVNLAQSVEQVLELYRGRIAAKEISIRTELDPNVLVMGSKGELRQVISNVILNSVDAVARAGRISVRVSRARRDAAHITVADNGSGIPRESRSKLFQPFFTTKRDVGTGLGLWVSKGIVEKHGGRILVRSSVRDGSSGTTFLVKLPRIIMGEPGNSAANR